MTSSQMFGDTADKSLGGGSSRRVNLVFTSRRSTPNSKLLHAVATSGRNEVFYRRHGPHGTAARLVSVSPNARRNYTASTDVPIRSTCD